VARWVKIITCLAKYLYSKFNLVVVKLIREDSKKNVINFCIKCFKGYLCLNYHNKKGWGIKCDQCHFRVSIL
jgi:hypothetical protein